MFFLHLRLAYQLENYQIMRFLRTAYRSPKFWIQGSDRQTVDRTMKMTFIAIGSVIFFLISNILTIWQFGFWGIFAFILSTMGFPLLIVLANLCLRPVDHLLKCVIMRKAKQRILQFPHVKIIAITGSYGKTTTKEYLHTILKSSLRTIATPGTHNTPLGISRFVLKHLTADVEVMIVEMGAYQIGDIATLCRIAPPDIAILTGLTAQHLERFGSMDNIIQAKFEAAMTLPAGGLFVYDETNTHIATGLKRFDKRLTDLVHVPLGVIDSTPLPDLQGISFSFEKHNYQTKLLAHHNAKNISLAIAVATNFKIPVSLIRQAVASLDFVPHRMQLIRSPKGVFVIDDSFNGNIEGVKSTLDFLSQTTISGKKIYLTPGLVELGEMNEQAHLDIGTRLAVHGTVDLILLIDTSATKFIRQGLQNAGYPIDQIRMYPTTLEAHATLPQILQKNDLIVFQNDWTDNYG